MKLYHFSQILKPIGFNLLEEHMKLYIPKMKIKILKKTTNRRYHPVITKITCENM